jgi:diguanylate cyclase (GGDEF)-like protein
LFEIEIRTAAFTSAAVALVAANGIFTIWWRDRRPYLRDWARGYGLTALGMLLVSLRGLAPDFVSILLGNLAATYGVLRLEAGTHRFVELPRRRHADLLVLGLLAIPFLFFYLLQPSTGARIIITGVAQGVVLLNICALLARSARRATWPAMVLTGFSFAVLAGVQFFRAWSALVTPVPTDLMRAGHIQGVLFVMATLVMVATVIGYSSMHAQRLLLQLEKMARTDQLTGMLNRRSLEESAQREVERAARSGEPLWVFMVDVDHFKRINDRHGHQTGDRVLQQVAAALHATLRPYDVLGRYGGEEFALVLPGLGTSAAVVVAERLRAAVQQPAADRNLSLVELTVSVGAAQVAPGETSWFQALGRADAALYEAKQTGRDRAVIRDAGDATPTQPERPALRMIR